MGLSTAAAAALLVAFLSAAPGRAPQAAVPPVKEPQVKQGEPRVKLGEQPGDETAAREKAIERARKHLSTELDVKLDEVTVEKVTPRTWPDASLGCPEKDRMYAQVVSPGYEVVLKAGAETHEVHVSGTRTLTCRKKQGPGTQEPWRRQAP